MNGNRIWRIVTAILVLIWVIAAVRLMVADVWDETNALVAFGSDTWSTGEAVRFVLTESMGIWRPLPSALAVLVIRGIDNPDIAWRVMRAINIVLLLASLALLVHAMNRWSPGSPRRTALFTLTFLYSAGAVITAGWFANLFDAWTLVFIAGGVAFFTHGRAISAGVLFGVAFFCKETAALALPMLVLFRSAGFLSNRELFKAGLPATALGLIYFALRNQIIPLGSAADQHQFALSEFFPTLLGVLDGYWRQTMWGSGPGVIGVLTFAVSVVAMPTWRARATYLLFVAATAAIYWEMFGTYQNGVLMHYLIFVGRLFLIPAVITLFVIATSRREWALAVLAIPLLIGAGLTWVRYDRFQSAYRHIYEQRAPMRIHYPAKPLNDPRRKLEIGDFPDATWGLDPATGRLTRRGQ